MNDRELTLRRTIFEALAATGEPPRVDDAATLRSLAEQHVVVLDDEGAIVMAHPFAAPRPGATRVDGRGRVWHGNCAWDGLGLVAALGLDEAIVESGGVRLRVRDGEVLDDAVFHVLVPAARWWDDPAYT